MGRRRSGFRAMVVDICPSARTRLEKRIQKAMRGLEDDDKNRQEAIIVLPSIDPSLRGKDGDYLCDNAVQSSKQQ